MDTYTSGGYLVEIFITEPEDLQLIKENISTFEIGVIVSVKESTVPNCYDVQIMVDSPTHLYLLGRYVGCDRKRLHDLDF